MSTCKCWALLAALVGLAGCAAGDDSASAEPGDMHAGGDPDLGVAADAAPDAVPGCVFAIDGACLDDPALRCAWAAELGPDCPDVDGDCFPDCVMGDRELDCDDTRADANPLGEQRCTGYDGDCDGRVDEGYSALGGECEACGAPGKFECAVDTLDDVACSSAPGQSEPAEFAPETCNGDDDDCDGAIDEHCAIDSGGPALAMPTVCPDGRIALVQDGALALATPSETGYDVEVMPREAAVAHPHCGPAGLAWLEVGEAGCATPAGGPLRCAAELWAMLGDAPPVMIAAFGSIGPPRVGLDAVYWHTIAGDAPAVLVRRADQPSAERLLDGPYSDPTPPVDGWMLVREWSAPADGEAASSEAALVAIEDGAHATLSSPGSGAGPVRAVARSATWLAWLVGDASPDIWVLRADTLRRGGFFPLSSTGERTRPHLVGDRLVWLDPMTAPPTLRAFDLGSGVEQVLATGQIALDGFAVGAGVVVWVDEADDTLRRRGLAPIGE